MRLQSSIPNSQRVQIHAWIEKSITYEQFFQNSCMQPKTYEIQDNNGTPNKMLDEPPWIKFFEIKYIGPNR
jgi:hypothetical protein